MKEIQELKRQGLSVSEVAALAGCDRKTVRKYLASPAAGPSYGPRAARPSKLEPFIPFIEQRLQAGVWNAQVLLRELTQQGYAGGYTLLKSYLQPKRQAAGEVACRRFETPPGHQGQLDWGTLGDLHGRDGHHTLYGLVFTLGHSRAMFADIATDQKLGTLLALHEAAFAALGGVPREVLYDHMKTVILGTDARGEPQWQPLFRDFARYWGFTPRVCRPYRPQTKGKVESGIKYVRRNFLCGRTADSVADLRQQLYTWTWAVAQPRVHGTTHRVVQEAWEAERPHLLSMTGRPPFPYGPETVRRVSRDAYVSYQSNRYPVPWAAAGREVTLRVVGSVLEIRLGDELLATHPLCRGQHQVLTLADHYAGLPTAPSGPPSGKTRITVIETPPTVEARSLAAYEALAEGAA